MVYNYSPNDLYNVRYNPANENSFVVFVQNKMYLCSKSAFKQNSGNKFIVTELSESADNLIDFKKALEI